LLRFCLSFFSIDHLVPFYHGFHSTHCFHQSYCLNIFEDVCSCFFWFWTCVSWRDSPISAESFEWHFFECRWSWSPMLLRGPERHHAWILTVCWVLYLLMFDRFSNSSPLARWCCVNNVRVFLSFSTIFDIVSTDALQYTSVSFNSMRMIKSWCWTLIDFEYVQFIQQVVTWVGQMRQKWRKIPEMWLLIFVWADFCETKSLTRIKSSNIW
jgi:hypothetical protein